MNFIEQAKAMLRQAEIPLLPTALVAGIVVGAIIPTSILGIVGVLGFVYWLMTSTPEPAVL